MIRKHRNRCCSTRMTRMMIISQISHLFLKSPSALNLFPFVMAMTRAVTNNPTTSTTCENVQWHGMTDSAVDARSNCALSLLDPDDNGLLLETEDVCSKTIVWPTQCPLQLVCLLVCLLVSMQYNVFKPEFPRSVSHIILSKKNLSGTD